MPAGCEASKKLFESKMSPLVGQVREALLGTTLSFVTRVLFTGCSNQVHSVPTGFVEGRATCGGTKLSLQGAHCQGSQSNDYVWGATTCLSWLGCSRYFGCSDLAHGEDAANILERCPWWATYKGVLVAQGSIHSHGLGCGSSPWHDVAALDQKHDLFISSTPVAGYLTGPTATVAGYLTVC
jgi:hypothetical protein